MVNTTIEPTAVAAYLAEVGQLIPRTERAWIRVIDAAHQHYLDAGQLQAAASLATDAHAVIRQRAIDEPGNDLWQRDLSVSHNKFGDLAAAAGDWKAAGAEYATALALAQRLADAHPDNAEWQRDLSICHERHGDLAIAENRRAAAAEAYATALAIAVRLSLADPTNMQWQRDLSISYERQGDLALGGGDPTAAGDAYATALAIAQRLADDNPADTRWRDEARHARGRIRLAMMSYPTGSVISQRPAFCRLIRSGGPHSAPHHGG